jgi:hypothetical protein
MGALAGKTCSPRLLPARAQGVLCIGGGLGAVGALLGRRAVVGLLFGSHVVVQVGTVLGRGSRILGFWGGHDIPSTTCGPGARTDAAVVGCSGHWRRTLSLRAAVSVRSWDGPGTTAQPMRLVRTAAGVPAACFGVRSRVRWLLERVLPWHSDSSNDGDDGGAGRRLAVNPARRYGTILLWYRAGVGAIEGAFQEHTESWLIADATETRRPCCWSRAVLRKRSPGRRDGGGRDGWGVASRQGRRDAAAVGRRCGTALGGGRAVLKLLAGEATRGRRDGRGRCGGSASWWAMGAAAALERRGGGAAGEVSTLGWRMRCDCDVTCWRCAHTMQSPHWPSKFADWKSGSCRLDLGPGAGTAWRLA